MSAVRACLTIDLEALAHNHAVLRAAAPGAEVAPVVKADAYGLGLGPVARRLWAEGARSFFVARLDEGETLRAELGAARPARILVLDGAPAGAAPRLAAAGLIPVLNSLDHVEEAAAFARDHGPMEAALHIDTGMNRLGLRPEEAEALAGAAGLPDGLKIGLVMSHLACAAEPDHPLNAAQLGRFRAAAARFPDARRSLANSAGVFLGEDFGFDMVRPGISLYGGGPLHAPDPRFKAVARFEAPILQVRTVPPGESIGYGATFTTARPTRIALIAAGYADGTPWSASGRGFAWFGGARRAMLGRVSMDVIAIDMDGCASACPGAMVELLGEHAPLDDVAAAAGAAPYELLVRLNRRAERVYLGEIA